jgi:cell division septation protein DedD
MNGMRTGRLALMLCSAAVLTGCAENSDFNFFGKDTAGAEVTGGLDDPSSVKLVERDVEAPEVFQVNDKGLWDGRPSLGGVWVAHPDVSEPERVIVRNADTGKFVIGALFKRERDNPGPRFQVSSDAAAALGMLAGAPGPLNVTALRRQEVPLSGETPAAAADAPGTLEAPEAIATTTLEDPVATASAALDRVETPLPVDNVVPVSAPAEVPAPKPAAKPAKIPGLAKPFVQIGLFSVEDNAERNGTALRNAGILPTIRKEESSGKTYWRVVVGPAPNAAERRAMLVKVKKLGYADAYFVTD